MELPPSAGAVQLIVAEPSPAVAVTFGGGPGTVAAGSGVNGAEGTDEGPAPPALTAATVTVYVAPSDRPPSVALQFVPEQAVLAGTLAVMPPGAAVTV